VGYRERSDADLVERSQAGVAPAFAVLLHRHGPTVRSAVRDDRDPLGAVVEVFVRAMRELPERDPAEPVRPWLLELAGTDRIPDPIVPLSEEERDEIWAELAVRWPAGRPPRDTRALKRVGLVAGLIAVSALVPSLVLLAGHVEPEPIDELRAFPLQTAVEVADERDTEPLPSFTFPTVPELEEPSTDGSSSELTAPSPPEPTATAAASSTPAPGPEASSAPGPSPAPSPTPAPPAEPGPAPSRTPAPTPAAPVEPSVEPPPEPEADAVATGPSSEPSEPPATELPSGE
jgi:hypothetical protein